VFALRVLGLSLVALAISWFGAYRVLRHVGKGAPIDVPNHRSSHYRSIARGGGIGMALAICLALMVVGSRVQGVPRGDIGLFAIATVIIAAVGLWADFRNPPASYRLFIQLGAAGLVMGAGMQLQVLKLPWGHNVELWWAAVPLTLLWITAVTNLANFIDGADGLATSLAIVYSSGVAVAAFGAGHPFSGIIALTVVAGCLGFLWFNFPPARLFMGDVGSLTLGFVLAVLAIRLATVGTQQVPLMFFLILYSSFLFDTTYTILWRAIRGEKFWVAHRLHLYERLLSMGWSHLRVTLLYVGLSLISLVLAFGYLRSGPAARSLIVGGQLLICFGQLVFVKVIENSPTALAKPRPAREEGVKPAAEEGRA
jgi:UDP-N-acetylmuramyl pentapeptide phosphotransferase/UDP-N-acetylglucosamine-1-phosphate transferase